MMRDVTFVSLSAGFSTVFGPFGEIFVSVSLLLFAFTSLLGCCYYGERGLEYLSGSNRWRGIYRIIFLWALVWGSVADVTSVGELADIFRSREPRGEFVLVVEGAPAREEGPADLDGALARVEVLRSQGLSLKQATAQAAEEFGCRRRKLYELTVAKK